MLYHLLDRMEECKENLKARLQRRDKEGLHRLLGASQDGGDWRSHNRIPHRGIRAEGSPQLLLLLYHTVAVSHAQGTLPSHL